MSMQELTPSQAVSLEESLAAQKRTTRRQEVRGAIAIGVLWAITLLVAAIFVFIIIRLLIEGAPTLLQASFYGTGEAGIAPELFNTFYILILAEIFLFPISLAAAIFLVE